MEGDGSQQLILLWSNDVDIRDRVGVVTSKPACLL